MKTRVIAELKILNTVIGKPVTLVFTRNEEDVMSNPQVPIEQGIEMQVTEGELSGLTNWAIEDLKKKLMPTIAWLHNWKSW